MTLTFDKCCLHVLDVCSVDESEEGLSQQAASWIAQHIGQPGHDCYRKKLPLVQKGQCPKTYHGSACVNFISREWRDVKTPSWLMAGSLGLISIGLAVPRKRAPDNPEAWLPSPLVWPVMWRGLYKAYKKVNLTHLN